MNILIIGQGGREQALAWKISQSPKVKKVSFAPEKDLIEWIKKNTYDLIIIGPDNYLADGIVDTLEALQITVFGPTKAASEIEWSKAFAKQFMKEEGIPTATYEVFTDLDKAKKYVLKQSFPLVIKASGLALGKGVIIAQSSTEATTALEEILSNKIFGDAGDEVIIEEFLQGKEISIHAFCDGETALLFPPAQDHKRIFENDKGPNTGGMGTIAPVPWISSQQMKEINETVVIPTLNALKKRGRTFKGILFPGIMITKQGPKVIEFNARFGDPETQSYMRILESDLVDILLSCTNGTLKNKKIVWSKQSSCCIVCASGGYPGTYEKGKVIRGLNKIKGAIVFHAGTKRQKNKIITNAGRVLGVTAVGKDLKMALKKAYTAVKKISFEGMQYRGDVGKKSL